MQWQQVVRNLKKVKPIYGTSVKSRSHKSSEENGKDYLSHPFEERGRKLLFFESFAAASPGRY